MFVIDGLNSKNIEQLKSTIYNFDFVENMCYVQAHQSTYKTRPHLSNKADVITFQSIGITVNTFFDYNAI